MEEFMNNSNENNSLINIDSLMFDLKYALNIESFYRAMKNNEFDSIDSDKFINLSYEFRNEFDKLDDEDKRNFYDLFLKLIQIEEYFVNYKNEFN